LKGILGLKMKRFFTRRFLAMFPTLIGVSILVFLMIRLIPGDPALVIAGSDATVEDIARIRQQMGLDSPIHVQYLIFIQNSLRGDLGRSIRTHRPVIEEIKEAYPKSIELVAAGMVIAVLLGVTTGILSASKQYSIFDRLSMLVCMLGMSIPSFWFGLMLIILFAGWLGWFPVSGS
jgi:peptide/nickel transport system permease protein